MSKHRLNSTGLNVRSLFSLASLLALEYRSEQIVDINERVMTDRVRYANIDMGCISIIELLAKAMSHLLLFVNLPLRLATQQSQKFSTL